MAISYDHAPTHWASSCKLKPLIVAARRPSTDLSGRPGAYDTGKVGLAPDQHGLDWLIGEGYKRQLHDLGAGRIDPEQLAGSTWIQNVRRTPRRQNRTPSRRRSSTPSGRHRRPLRRYQLNARWRLSGLRDNVTGRQMTLMKPGWRGVSSAGGGTWILLPVEPGHMAFGTSSTSPAASALACGRSWSGSVDRTVAGAHRLGWQKPRLRRDCTIRYFGSCALRGFVATEPDNRFEYCWADLGPSSLVEHKRAGLSFGRRVLRR